MAIANALQLEAARRRVVSIRLNTSPFGKFVVAQTIRCRLRERIYYFTADTLRYAVTLTSDPVTLTFDLEPSPVSYTHLTLPTKRIV